MTNAYTIGFLDKVAELRKRAAMYYGDLTSEQRKDQKKLDKDFRDKINKSKEVKRLPAANDFKTEASRKLKSLGLGAYSSAKATTWRALEGLAGLLAMPIELPDQLIAGALLGVNHGKGFTGDYTSKFHRYIDKKVHNARQRSYDFDYKNRINSPLNRFMQGGFADTLGTVIGFGGLSGVGKKGIVRYLGPTLGIGLSLPATLSGQFKDLRDREAFLRKIGPEAAKYFDPTSTAFNRQNSPTKREYHTNSLPINSIPSSWSGNVYIPSRWRYNKDTKTPTIFMEYANY